ncbi:serine protease inhibitor 42Dd isoform X2 [Drosophila hydei]|uniref:Serine protease inhibitor 42Dd isoform X2 n=1 Tax=Drosophila hydei TaxID=7224 RepID=A0A6J1L6V8_DROHY|nr:serine protease inhibitor 42Dd isoform X2 [Drosophila hydei]
MASGGTLLTPPTPNQILFARNFLLAVNKNKELQAQNLIISPAGARSALTLVFMGAGGKTADELRSGLMLGPAKKIAIAKQHAEFISNDCVCNEKGVSIRLATGLYVRHDQDVHPEFVAQAEEFFNTQANTLNFVDAVGSMHQVNSWLQRQTFNTVCNLLTADAFSLESKIFLVNTLYFRARWAKSFSVQNTELGDFTISSAQKMQVPMMRQYCFNCTFRSASSALASLRR